MKRTFLIIAIICLAIGVQAQLTITKGLKVGSTTITNEQVGKIPYILDSRDAVLTYTAAEVDAFKYPFTIQVEGSAISSPADATNYYIGAPINQSHITPAGYRKQTSVLPCTLFGFSCTISVVTPGSNETYSIYIRVNSSTDYLLASTFKADGSVPTQFSANNLNISLNAGDTWELKIVTPTWGTNPATLIHSFCLYFKTAKL